MVETVAEYCAAGCTVMWTLWCACGDTAHLLSMHKPASHLYAQDTMELCQDTHGKPCCRLHQHVDFVVCLGGDGTILHASSLFQRAIPPVISFSAGSLGFLTNHSLENVEADLKGVIYGSEDLDQCSLEEEVWRCGSSNKPACYAQLTASLQHTALKAFFSCPL